MVECYQYSLGKMIWRVYTLTGWVWVRERERNQMLMFRTEANKGGEINRLKALERDQASGRFVSEQQICCPQNCTSVHPCWSYFYNKSKKTCHKSMSQTLLLELLVIHECKGHAIACQQGTYYVLFK